MALVTTKRSARSNGPAPPRMGRRARQADVLFHLRTGVSRRHAARLAFVSDSTLYRWLETGQFREACERVEAEWVREKLEQADRAIRRGSGKLALDLISRRIPETWQPRSRVEIDSEPADLTDFEWQIVKMLRERQAWSLEEKQAELEGLRAITG